MSPVDPQHSVFETVKTLILDSHPRPEKMKKVAQEIADTFLRDHDFSTSLDTYVRGVCFAINGLKIRTVGMAADGTASNTLLQLVAAHWIGGTGVTNRDREVALGVADALLRGPETSWYHPKVYSVGQLVHQKLQTEWIARNFRPPEEAYAAMDSLRASGFRLDDFNRALLQALHERRKYGVKPAYFQDGFIHQPEQAWVILGMEDVSDERMDPLGLVDDCMAWFLLARKDELQSLALCHRTDGVGVRRASPQFRSYASWFFQRDGQLTLSSSGLLPARDIFVAEGKEEEFSLITLIQLMRLYDLTVPLRIVGRVPGMPPQPVHLGRPQGDAERIRRLLDPRLLLPRLRELTEDPQRATQEFETESAQDEERTLRRIRRHVCIGHARVLPMGRHASPRAQALAAADGVTLEPNETYVKKHERGVGDVPLGTHRAVRRKLTASPPRSGGSPSSAG